MKIIIGLFCVLFTLIAFPASVEWGVFDIGYQGGYGGVSFYGIDRKTDAVECAVIDIDVVPGESGVRVASCSAFLETCCAWVLASQGTVVDEEFFNSRDSYFFRYGLYGDTDERRDYDLQLGVGESVYLAVMVTSYTTPDEYFKYGWLEIGLSANGVLYAVDSALGLDGQSLVVGGGSATPEPSGMLLMLVGGALLALRRCGAKGMVPGTEKMGGALPSYQQFGTGTNEKCDFEHDC